MKEPAPEVLRKGAVVRVTAHRHGAPATAHAIAFVDLRFDDGHVERWLGSGSLRDDPADPVQHSDLLVWGKEVAIEHEMVADLEMAFRAVDRDALSRVPVEIVFEWNAQLPEFD